LDEVFMTVANYRVAFSTNFGYFNFERSLHACRQLPHGVFYNLLATSY
jgi:hypothetical protein